MPKRPTDAEVDTPVLGCHAISTPRLVAVPRPRAVRYCGQTAAVTARPTWRAEPRPRSRRFVLATATAAPCAWWARPHAPCTVSVQTAPKEASDCRGCDAPVVIWVKTRWRFKAMQVPVLGRVRLPGSDHALIRRQNGTPTASAGGAHKSHAWPTWTGDATGAATQAAEFVIEGDTPMWRPMTNPGAHPRGSPHTLPAQQAPRPRPTRGRRVAQGCAQPAYARVWLSLSRRRTGSVEPAMCIQRLRPTQNEATGARGGPSRRAIMAVDPRSRACYPCS